MPLPLTIRKSLRDNEEHLTQAVENLKATTGQDWTFEFDFETIYEKLAKDCDYPRNNAGDFFYKTIALNVADCIKSTCAKDEIAKEALIEANSNNKVIVRVNEEKKNVPYWKYIFENNSLVLLFNPSVANTSDISYFDLAAIIPSPGVMSLKARMDIRENTEAINEELEKIKAVTKRDWTYDEASLEQCYATFGDYQERIGSILKDIITNVSYNICNRCKDEMILEAFDEVTQNSKIVLRVVPKQSEYWVWSFESGNVVVSFKSICNVGDISYLDFEKLL
ncbi:hypothetical protein SAMD00019534_102340 [Acytostelium subglobosum LB1]|uniref:hypothetical protein n=1 Tax=Acytostelium subglobosum LB1 TaxID=1410327 RepID=UPI000644CF0A|nr:hypothetical protein SAMD00019534_102340 [Acytostelium subglobosum LB1]GAM27059.1 hypothetical protein SAMD00019534_102340 [Acytostelium subglobosum LB1]|eukprot:XP_012749939.1 hypothetical protein SAMD00019534_102340 [Acytostelium subglobosum LB1]